MSEAEVTVIVVETIGMIVVLGLAVFALMFLISLGIDKYMDWKFKRYQKKQRRELIDRQKDR